MKLIAILEGSRRTLNKIYGKDRVKDYADALSFMPKKKVKHSLRVGATAAKSGLDKEGIEAAILHDFIERGGDQDKLAQLNVSQKAIRIIKMLSIDEKTPGLDDTQEVQHHIELMLNDQSISQHDKDVAIIVKCADRIDNLKKRIKQKRLEPHYKQASLRLFNTLISHYRGDHNFIVHIKKQLSKLNLDTR